MHFWRPIHEGSIVIKVCIEIDDNGQISVGEEGPEESQEVQSSTDQMGALMGGDEGQMQQVGSIDEALQIARQLLSQSGAEEEQMAEGFGKPAAPTMMARA